MMEIIGAVFGVLMITDLYASRLDRHKEHVMKRIVIPPVVEAINNLADVQAEVLLADVVELPVDCAFHDSPEALDAVGVDAAVLRREHVIGLVLAPMVDTAVNDHAVHAVITVPFVGVEDGTGAVQRGTDESGHLLCGHVDFVNGLRLHAPIALDDADNGLFVSAAPTLGSVAARRVVVAPVALAGLPADERLVHLNDSGQQFAIVLHGGADAVHHAPYGRAAHVEVTGGLHGRQPLFRGKHERNQKEPPLQVNVAVVEDRADSGREGLVA